MSTRFSLPISLSFLLPLLLAGGCDGCGEGSSPLEQPTSLGFEIGSYRSESNDFQSIRLYWQGVEGAEAYEVQRADPDEGVAFRRVHWGGDWHFQDFGTPTPAGFVPGHSYVYRVRAQDEGAGPWSDELKVELPPFLPPANVTADYVASEAFVRISWDEVEVSGVRYEIERDEDLQGSYQWAGETGTGETTYDDRSQLSRGAMYSYRVRAVHTDYGRSAFSSFASVELPPVPAPVMVDASTGRPHSIIVRWLPVEGAVYQVLRAEETPERDDAYHGGGWEGIAAQDGHVAYEDSSVVSGRWYHYKVRAMIDGTEGAPSENFVSGYVGEHSPDEAPPTPAEISVYPGGTYIGLQWMTVASANAYRIFRLAAGEDVNPNISEEALEEFELLAEVGAESWAGSNWANHQDRQTDSGRRYYYFVRAVNEHGESLPSTVVSAHWGGGDVPGRPVITATDGDYSNAIIVSWSPVERGDWYRVYRANLHDYQVQLGEPLSDWIHETEFVAFTTTGGWVVVRARTNLGIEGAISNHAWGTVSASAPEYEEPGDDPLADYLQEDLGEVPVGSGAGPLVDLDVWEANGVLHIASLEDPGGAYEYGTPHMATFSSGSWSPLPSLPQEIMDSATVRRGISSAGDGTRVYFAASDHNAAYLYELEAGTWSENLAADNFGYAAKPGFVGVVLHAGDAHVAIETPQDGNLRVLRRSGDSWVGTGGDGYLTSGERVLDIGMDVLGGELHVIYRTASFGDDEATLHIRRLDGTSWQTALTWTHDYVDMPVDRPQMALAPDGTLFFKHGYPQEVYRVTSSTTVENVRPGWCMGPFAIAVDAGGNLFLTSRFWDADIEDQYPVLGVLEGGVWKRVAGDFSSAAIPVGLATAGSDVYFVYGDGATVPPLRHEARTLKALRLTTP